MPTKPTYDQFATRERRGTFHVFLSGLKEGVPTKVPEPWAGKKTAALGNQKLRSESKLGCRFAFRNIDGETWVCRLKPEDAK